MSNNNIIKNIKKNIFTYIIWIIVAIVVVAFEVSFATRVKDTEQVNFFFSYPNLKEQEFFQLLKDNEPSYIRSISYRNVNYNDSETFMNTMASHGQVNTDIFIFPTEAINKVSPQGYFFYLDEEKTNTIFGQQLEYIKDKDGDAFGFKIHSSFFNDDKLEFYMMFSRRSLHLGELNNSSLDADITYAKLIMNS